MKFSYGILQFKDIEKCEYAFCGYETALERGLSLEDYTEVYTGESGIDNPSSTKEINAWLESIFEMFNIRRPVGFKGHSLSVSDIVRVDTDYYYVDSWGFAKLDVKICE